MVSWDGTLPITDVNVNVVAHDGVARNGTRCLEVWQWQRFMNGGLTLAIAGDRFPSGMDTETPASMSELPATVNVEPDWNAIRERYLQGDEINAIAADFGVTANAISCQAYRNKWKDAQLRLLSRDKVLLGEEIRGNVLLSVLKESRMLQRMDPSTNPVEADLWSKVRDRLVSTSSRLLGWDADPIANAKPARCLEV